MSKDERRFPILSTPVIIRQERGRTILGEVVKVDRRKGLLQLAKASVLEDVGLRGALEPIYSKKISLDGRIVIPIQEIAHWEKAPHELVHRN